MAPVAATSKSTIRYSQMCKRTMVDFSFVTSSPSRGWNWLQTTETTRRPFSHRLSL